MKGINDTKIVQQKMGAQLKAARGKIKRPALVQLLICNKKAPVESKAEMTAERLKQWEYGNNPISLEWIPAICDVLRCDVGYLFGDYPEKTREISDICSITGLSPAAAKAIIGDKYDGFRDTRIEALNFLLVSANFENALHSELSQGTRECMPARYPNGVWRCAAIRVEQDPQNCSAEAETFLYSRLYGVVQSLFDQMAFAHLALCDTGYLLLILNGPDEAEMERIAWKKIHSVMLEEVRGFGGTQTVIALSGMALSADALCALAQEAKGLLRERLVEPETWLIEPTGRKRPDAVPLLGKTELAHMENATAVLDAAACREILERTFSFAAGTASKDGAAACAMAEMLFDRYLKSISKMTFISEEERRADQDQWDLLLRNVTGFETLRSVMTQFLTDRLAYYRKKKEQMDSRPVLLAKNWIEAHTEQPCTLQEVSDHVRISPTYL